MRVLLRIPAIVSCLLLAAHLLRNYGLLPAVVALGLPVLLGWRWGVRVVQVVLVVATAEWLWAGWRIVSERLAAGERWHAAAIIMGSVAGFTLVSAGCLQGVVRRWPVERAAGFPVVESPERPQGPGAPGA